MPTKSDRRVALPAGLVPLLTQPQLETYFDVSDWTVLQWIREGMPVIHLAPTGKARYARRRFDLQAVCAWHAERSGTAPVDQEPALQSA
jgi:phage terminase Nu1 subunit (DNA packaging protein)